jgi:hypothetical protein
MRTRFFLLAAAGLTAFMPQVASAQTNDCLVGATRTNTTLAAQSTTSQTFVDVAGASVDFTADGPCAIVQVTAQVRAANPRTARIRVIVQETVEGALTMTVFPTSASLYTSQNRLDQRTVRFVLRNIPTGDKILKVQFLSVDGSPVSLSKVITTVYANTLL